MTAVSSFSLSTLELQTCYRMDIYCEQLNQDPTLPLLTLEEVHKEAETRELTKTISTIANSIFLKSYTDERYSIAYLNMVISYDRIIHSYPWDKSGEILNGIASGNKIQEIFRLFVLVMNARLEKPDLLLNEQDEKEFPLGVRLKAPFKGVTRDIFSISDSVFVIQGIIGSGGFSTIYSALDLERGVECACKIVKKDSESLIRREIVNIGTLNRDIEDSGFSPIFVETPYSYMTTADKSMFVYFTKKYSTDLDLYLKKHTMSPEERLNLAVILLDGFSKIIHINAILPDVNLANVLVEEFPDPRNNKIYFSDLGDTFLLEDVEWFLPATTKPFSDGEIEARIVDLYSKQTDVEEFKQLLFRKFLFNFSTMIYNLLSGQYPPKRMHEPYKGFCDIQSLYEICPKTLKSYGTKIIEDVQRMIHPDPKLRYHEIEIIKLVRSWRLLLESSFSVELDRKENVELTLKSKTLHTEPSVEKTEKHQKISL